MLSFICCFNEELLLLQFLRNIYCICFNLWHNQKNLFFSFVCLDNYL